MVSVGPSVPKERGRLYRKSLLVSSVSNLTIPSPLPHYKCEHILLAVSWSLEDGDTSDPINLAYPCQLSTLGSCPRGLQELSGPAGKSA